MSVRVGHLLVVISGTIMTVPSSFINFFQTRPRHKEQVSSAWYHLYCHTIAGKYNIASLCKSNCKQASLCIRKNNCNY